MKSGRTKTLSQITLAFWTAVLISPLSWSGNAGSAAQCVIERGQDPLAAVSLSGTTPLNVFMIFDTSSSMGQKMDGNDFCDSEGTPSCESLGVQYSGDHPDSKFYKAKKAVLSLIDDPTFEDMNGAPLVNWGFAYFGQNNNSNRCAGQYAGDCTGLAMADIIDPPRPGQPDSRPAIRDRLKPTVDGGIAADTVTPLGVSIDQLSKRIQTRYLPKLEPGQANYILVVTDGADSCECDTQVWDGNRRAMLRESSRTSTPGMRARGEWETASYNTGLKASTAYDRIDPGHDGCKGDIFVLTIGDDPGIIPLNNNIAWEASGVSFGRPGRPAFLATDSSGVRNALKGILSQILEPPLTFSTGGAVVGTVKELIPQSNTAVTADDVDAVTSDAADYARAKGAIKDHKDNVLFTTEIRSPGYRGSLAAYKVYDVVTSTAGAKGASAPTKRAAYVKLWDAGTELQNRSPNDRNVYFNRRGETVLRPFTTNDVTAADLDVGPGYLGARTAQDAAQIVVKVVQGYRLIRDPVTGPYDPNGRLNFSEKDETGTNTWKLWDSTSEGPALVNAPQRSPNDDPPPYRAAEYRSFYDLNFNRQSEVYLATNGGMLHAFDAHTGAERWAYIPDDVLGISARGEVKGSHATLKDWVEILVTGTLGSANHPYLMSGAVSAEDLWVNGKWRTVIALGRGRAGKFLTALDVTDTANWDKGYSKSPKPASPPTLLFNAGNREGVTDRDAFGASYDGLGETWSIPVMGEINGGTGDPQPVLFAGSGYGCKGSTEGQYLYALRVADGAVIKRFAISSSPNAPLQDNALVATVTLFNPHRFDSRNPNDFVSNLYVGDLQGNVYKLDCSDASPSQWTFNVFARLGLDQPIASPVALLPDGQRILVFAASGGDYRVTLPAGRAFTLAGFADDDPPGQNTPGDPVANYNGNPFTVSLPEGERVFTSPVTTYTSDGRGAVFFATVRPDVPSSGICSRPLPAFRSTLYAFEAATGAPAWDLNPASGTQSVLDLGNGKANALYLSTNHLYVSRSGGYGLQADTLVLGADTFGAAGDVRSTSRLTVNVLRWSLSPF